MESILGVDSIESSGSQESESTSKTWNRTPLGLLKSVVSWGSVGIFVVYRVVPNWPGSMIFLNVQSVWASKDLSVCITVCLSVYLSSLSLCQSDLEWVAKAMLRCNTQISPQTTLFCHAPKGLEIALPLWASLKGFSHWFSSIWRTHFKGRVYELSSLAAWRGYEVIKCPPLVIELQKPSPPNRISALPDVPT